MTNNNNFDSKDFLSLPDRKKFDLAMGTFSGNKYSLITNDGEEINLENPNNGDLEKVSNLFINMLASDELPDLEKKELLVGTMELIQSLEAKYLKNPLLAGVMNKLFILFISRMKKT